MPTHRASPRDPCASDPWLLGKRIAPSSILFPVAPGTHEALLWGLGRRVPAMYLGQMWTHYGFCSLALANPALDEQAIA